jgi:sodium-dependent dicarboxylate transporter 2/3/5
MFRILPRQTVGLYLGPAVFAILLLALLNPEPPAMVNAARTVGAEDWAPVVALATLVWVLIWWLTECVPLGLAALLVPLVFSATGIIPWRAALGSFTDPIIWIFIAGFVLAAAFRKWDLDRRISVRLASLYKGNNPRLAAFFVACLPVFILTLTGSITASTSVVLPFLVAYLAMIGAKGGSRFSEASTLALAQAATAGAMLLLISTPPNLIAKATLAQLPSAASYNLSFFDWLLVGTPQAVFGLLISWAVTFAFIKPEMKTLDVDQAKVAKARADLGAMSRGEKTVASLLLLAVTLWILPSAVQIIAESNPSLVPLADQLAVVMPEAMPAVLVILAAGTLRVDKEPVLRWKELVDGIDWNVVFLFGGGIALGIGLESSGFARWLASSVAVGLGASAGAWTIFAVSALLGFALSYVASNTAAALIGCPIAASLALGAGVSPVGPVVAAALACSISSAIPSTTPPMAIVYSSGYVRIWTMFRVGMVSDLLRLTALILTGPLFVALLPPAGG